MDNTEDPDDDAEGHESKLDDSPVITYEDEPDADDAEQDYNNVVYHVPEEHAAQVTRRFNEDGTIKNIIKARKSPFVHTLVHLSGQKFDFKGRGYLIPLYDRRDRQILLKTGRQVEKTTFLANNLTADSVIIPYNKSLYVSPSHTQTRQFSNEKLKPAIEGSPLIKKYFQDSSVSQQVFEKGFTNGSY